MYEYRALALMEDYNGLYFRKDTQDLSDVGRDISEAGKNGWRLVMIQPGKYANWAIMERIVFEDLAPPVGAQASVGVQEPAGFSNTQRRELTEALRQAIREAAS